MKGGGDSGGAANKRSEEAAAVWEVGKVPATCALIRAMPRPSGRVV